MKKERLAEELIEIYRKRKDLDMRKTRIIKVILKDLRSYITKNAPIDPQEGIRAYVNGLGLEGEDRKILIRVIRYHLAKTRGTNKCIPLTSFIDKNN
jgi:transcription initiation factor TFIIIB Brf1 subunit/transcription initiation factor TFIIB